MTTIDHVPVEHRWAGLDRRTLVPAVGALCVAALWALVLPAVDDAIAQDRQVEPGTVLTAGQDVTLVPPVGWAIESGVDAGGQSLPEPAKVSTGATSVKVVTVEWTGSLHELLARANELHEESDDGSWHVAGAQGSVTTDDGATGIVEPFTSTSGTGQIYVFLHDDVGVEVVATSSFSSLGHHQRAIDELVATIRFDDDGSGR